MKDKGILKRFLLGLGFDCKDGIWRVTRGKNFHLFGGSEDTHDEMQEKAIKMNEELSRRKKTLDSISTEEFIEIAEKLKIYNEE
jgi:hypothetical protein